MIPRLLKEKLVRSPKSVILIGPRQVGKSTLINSLEPDLAINLADDKTYLDFTSNPGELTELLRAKKVKTVFIDEIQRHTTLLNSIQAILDSKEFKGKIKFFLSGSSARKLKRGQANLLPGRVFKYELGSLCAAELGYQLNVKRALQYGCLPEPYLMVNEEYCQKLLTTYSGGYLKEEIQAEALTRNLEGFSRFIMSAADTSGQILDFSKIAKEAKIERKECSRFYEILEDTLIATRLEVFAKTNADIKKRPKYYFFDTGVLNGLFNNFTVSNDRKGLLFEHLVFNQILSSARAKDVSVNLSYFRTRAGFEVDFILEIGGKTFAVEVKSGKVDSKDAEKLGAFTEYYKKTDGFFIVVPDGEAKRHGPVLVCELNLFLKSVGL